MPPWQMHASNLILSGAGGSRAYIAISGGLDVPDYLGSKSTFPGGNMGGHQGRALRVGDLLPLIPAGEAAAGWHTLCFRHRAHSSGTLRNKLFPLLRHQQEGRWNRDSACLETGHHHHWQMDHWCPSRQAVPVSCPSYSKPNHEG
jgi:allophanate hydrolase subunit 2